MGEWRSWGDVERLPLVQVPAWYWEGCDKVCWCVLYHVVWGV